MIEDYDAFVFCQNVCTYHNRYDGWCHYNNCDVAEVKNCEYYKKKELEE